MILGGASFGTNMIIEHNEVPSGWPLGLGNMSTRLRVAETSRAAAAEPNSLHKPSSSFSSVSSSNLDTESTTSFFQDRSVSLGLLIGIKPGNRGRIVDTNTIHFQRHGSVSNSRLCSKGHGTAAAQGGLCVPLIHNALEKLSRSKSCSRH